MSTIVFPPSLTPAQATWELTHNVAGGSNPWGQVQRISRGSPVWSCSISMPTLACEDMAIWQAFEAQVARGDVRFYMPHPEPLRGSFDNSELLSNPYFLNGTSGWNSFSSGILSVGSRLMRVANGAASSGRAFQTLSLTVGKSYALVFSTLAGRAPDAIVQVTRSTDGTNYVADANVPLGVAVFGFTVAVDGSTHVRIGAGDTVQGNDVFIQSASVSRCLLVNGASQTGASLSIDAGDASTNGLLKVGDMFTVMIDGVPSLHRLTRDLDTNSSGEGTLYFEPALPGSPADNAPIILRNPFCRMYIPSHNASSAYKPPMHGSFALEALEDPTRP